MEENCLVSIIVPVYNTAQYLKKCIGSIVCQSYKNIEIILVDDGSTDDSLNICNEFALLDSRIQVIHKKNGGNTSARNAGIDVAQGEYIGFVDSDDWIEPEMYEVLLREMLACGAEVGVGLMLFEHTNNSYGDTQNVRVGFHKSSYEICENLFYTSDRKSRGITPSLVDKLFKRDILMRYQKKVDERTKYGEDACCVYPCLINATGVVFIDKHIYHCRVRYGSLQHSMDETYFGRITLCYLQLKEAFAGHEYEDVLLKQLKYYMLEHTVRGINSIFGFSTHPLIPYFKPPIEEIKKRNVKRIVLYGAGAVGQDYMMTFKEQIGIDVVLWCDKQYERYCRQGMKVSSIERIKDIMYDLIVIAAEKATLGEAITSDLLLEGVEQHKILYFPPDRMADDLED